MSPDRIAPFALALLAAGLVVAGLMVVGGPGEARRLQRDERRADDLSALANCTAYLVREDWDSLPEVLTETTTCTNASGWKDPQTDAPYVIKRISADDIEICAVFENVDSVARRYNLQDRFDPKTGCIHVRWGG